MALTEEETYRAVVDQALSLWIKPEIERRREAGSLAVDFELMAAQVVFAPGVELPVVRLNQEVVAVMRVRAKGPIEKGDPVTDAQIDGIDAIELTDLDADSGHVTIQRLRDQWFVSFDFRRNASTSVQTVAAADEFLSTARYALCEGLMHAFADNLFSATELLAKASLLLHKDRLRTTKKHQAILRPFKLWGHLGNTKSEYVRLLNDLARMLAPARYLDSDLELGQAEARHMLGLTDAFREDVAASLPPRHPHQMPS